MTSDFASKSGKKTKTIIPRLAYGAVSVGLGVVPLLACGSSDDTHTDAVLPAISFDAGPFSDATPTDAVFADAGFRSDASDAGDASSVEDAGDADVDADAGT